MLFTVVSEVKNVPVEGKEKVYLVSDNWDDWFEFSTQYYMIIFDSIGKKIEPGLVKIGQQGQSSGMRRPQIPDEFDSLGENFFSIGQSENYYESLNLSGDFFRDLVLSSLRDIAKDNSIYQNNKSERVLQVSLLRSVSDKNVEGRFHRLALGDAKLTKYDFSYYLPISPTGQQEKMIFSVEPESKPPTNIHVLIGRNGVGKTTCLTNMIKALTYTQHLNELVGRFEANDFIDNELKFSNLVSVSFSAFDSFEPPDLDNSKPGKQIKYSYIGLRRKGKSDDPLTTLPKSLEELSEDFTKSVSRCTQSARSSRWKAALSILESDPLFEFAKVGELASLDGLHLDLKAKNLYKNLSSGHKIVLLTITRLVELVDERSLVILDEPEGHLHPPLLSAFVRALSNLLVNRNGVGIIATHSPVVLQETPKSCVWILSRSGLESKCERPRSETFGESVGTLTREVFGLEVTRSGFHKLISDWVQSADSNLTYDDLLKNFNYQLGSEGQAIALGLMATKITPPP